MKSVTHVPELFVTKVLDLQGRRGKHAPVQIRKLIDTASPKLMEKCWDGKALPEVQIHCFRAGMGQEEKQPIRYLTIELYSVIIKKFEYNVSEGSLLYEDLELVAAEAYYEYRQMHKETGKYTPIPILTGCAGIKLGPEDFTDAPKRKNKPPDDIPDEYGETYKNMKSNQRRQFNSLITKKQKIDFLANLANPQG